MQILQKIKKILLWIVTVWFILFGLVAFSSGGILAGVFSFLAALVVIPIELWQNVLRRIIKKKWIFAIVLAILSFFAFPVSEPTEDMVSATTEATEAIEATEFIATTETTNAATVNTTEMVTIPETVPEETTSPNLPVVVPNDTEAQETEPTPEPTNIPETEPAPEPTQVPEIEPVPEPTSAPETEATTEPTEDNRQEYVLNYSTGKFHHPWCYSVDDMAEENKGYAYDTRENIIADGYSPCGRCDP